METYDITKAQFMKGLEQEGNKMFAAFEQLPQQYQLDGLDVFQDMVNRVVSKITDGRVRSVKFVPVEKNGSAGTQENLLSSQASTNGNTPSQEEIQVKQEPVDESVDRGTAQTEADNEQSFMTRLNSATQDGQGVRQVGLISVSADGEIRVKSEPVSDTEQEIDVGTEDYNNDDADDDDDFEANHLSAEYQVVTVDDEDNDRDDDDQPQKKKAKKKKEKKAAKDAKKFSCRHCDFSSDTRKELDAHHPVHTGNRKFCCPKCNKLFSAHSSLKRHLMAHEGVKPHVCPICSKPFIDLSSLRIHSTVHTGEREYQCDQCPKRYTNSANLSRHKRVHTGEKPYQCKLCDARYRDLSSLKLHHLRHTGEKPYLCEVCHKQFKTSSDFRRHERTHTQERNYECKVCKKRFVQGWHVTQHMKMHVDSRPYKCDQPDCGKTYRTKATLEAHIRNHLGIKQFHCVICNKGFTTKKYLSDHQVLHTDEKPFNCETCGQKFNQLSNLRRHQRIHSDERKFECRYCDATFKYSNAWKYHEGIHTGEMLQCQKCGLEFRSQKSVRHHKCDPSKFEENIERNAQNRQNEVEKPKKKEPRVARRSDRTKNKTVDYKEPMVKLERLDPDLILDDEVDLAPNDDVDIETVSDAEDDPMSFTSDETVTPPTLIPRPGEYASKYAINSQPKYTVTASDFNALLEQQISQQDKKELSRPPDPTEFVKIFDEPNSSGKLPARKRRKVPKKTKLLDSTVVKKKIKKIGKLKKTNVKLGKFKVKIGSGVKKSTATKIKKTGKKPSKATKVRELSKKKPVVRRRKKKSADCPPAEFVYPVNMVQIIVKPEPIDFAGESGDMMYEGGLSKVGESSDAAALDESGNQFEFETIAQMEGMDQSGVEVSDSHLPPDDTAGAESQVLPLVDVASLPVALEPGMTENINLNAAGPLPDPVHVGDNEGNIADSSFAEFTESTDVPTDNETQGIPGDQLPDEVTRRVIQPESVPDNISNLSNESDSLQS